MSVDPGTCNRAVIGDWCDHVVWDGEKDGDIGVEEASDDGWVGFFETESGEFEVFHGGGYAVWW